AGRNRVVRGVSALLVLTLVVKQAPLVSRRPTGYSGAATVRRVALSVNLTRRFQEALTYAADLHGDQLRKGTAIPYVSHLLAVAGLALEHEADEDEAIAALLHDGPEDRGGCATLEE